MVKMGNVWDRTSEVLGERGSAILPLALVGVLLPAIVGAVLGVYGGVPGGVSPAWSLVSLLASLLQIWGMLAITALVLDPALSSAGRVATGRFLPALGLYLLLVLGLFVLMLPLFVLVVMAGVDLTQMSGGDFTITRQLPRAYGLPLLAYMTAIFIVMLVVFTRLAPLTGVIVAERRGVGALAHAWRLTRGLTWRLIGVLILYVVVVAIATSAVQFVFGSVLGLVLGGTGPVTTAAIVTAVLGAIVSAIFTVVLSVFCAQLYLATTARAEGASRS